MDWSTNKTGERQRNVNKIHTNKFRAKQEIRRKIIIVTDEFIRRNRPKCSFKVIINVYERFYEDIKYYIY